MVEHLAMLAHFAVGATLSVSIVLCLVTSGPSKSPGRVPAPSLPSSRCWKYRLSYLLCRLVYCQSIELNHI